METIRVRRHGEAEPTVVVLHGGPGAPGSAAPLARALAERGVGVLEPLQRRAGTVALTVDRHVEDMLAVAPHRAVYVGWSWGAMLALSFAAAHPTRVAAIVLVGCGTFHEDERRDYKQRVADLLGEDGRAREAALRGRMAEAEDEAIRDALVGELGSLFMAAETVEPLAAPSLGDDLPVDGAGNRETWDDVLRLQAEGIEPQRFAGIDAPVLMLHGDTDPHPGRGTCERLRPLLPQLEYVEFPRCGHEPWNERHARQPFLATLLAWIRAHQGPA